MDCTQAQHAHQQRPCCTDRTQAQHRAQKKHGGTSQHLTLTGMAWTAAPTGTSAAQHPSQACGTEHASPHWPCRHQAQEHCKIGQQSKRMTEPGRW
eukprot:1160456-Pelagomonas_calceolata.AAC.4